MMMMILAIRMNLLVMTVVWWTLLVTPTVTRITRKGNVCTVCMYVLYVYVLHVSNLTGVMGVRGPGKHTHRFSRLETKLARPCATKIYANDG